MTSKPTYSSLSLHAMYTSFTALFLLLFANTIITPAYGQVPCSITGSPCSTNPCSSVIGSIDQCLVTMPIGNSPTDALTFYWEDCCTTAQDYEIQVLRLYNTDPANISTPTTIKPIIDWSQALSFQVWNSAVI